MVLAYVRLRRRLGQNDLRAGCAFSGRRDRGDDRPGSLSCPPFLFILAGGPLVESTHGRIGFAPRRFPRRWSGSSPIPHCSLPGMLARRTLARQLTPAPPAIMAAAVSRCSACTDYCEIIGGAMAAGCCARSPALEVVPAANGGHAGVGPA